MSLNHVYHEKQYLWRCGQHVVNNILQDQRYSTSDLDEIANNMSKVTGLRHRLPLGLGLYDFDVMCVALDREGFSTDRIDVSSVAEMPLDTIALIVHVPSNVWYRSAHWVALRRVGHDWFNLDSKLNAPIYVANVSQTVKNFQLPGADSISVFRIHKSGDSTTNEISEGATIENLSKAG